LRPRSSTRTARAHSLAELSSRLRKLPKAGRLKTSHGGTVQPALDTSCTSSSPRWNVSPVPMQQKTRQREKFPSKCNCTTVPMLINRWTRNIIFLSEYSTTSAEVGAHVEVIGSKDLTLAERPTMTPPDFALSVRIISGNPFGDGFQSSGDGSSKTDGRSWRSRKRRLRRKVASPCRSYTDPTSGVRQW